MPTFTDPKRQLFISTVRLGDDNLSPGTLGMKCLAHFLAERQTSIRL